MIVFNNELEFQSFVAEIKLFVLFISSASYLLLCMLFFIPLVKGIVNFILFFLVNRNRIWYSSFMSKFSFKRKQGTVIES